MGECLGVEFNPQPLPARLPTSPPYLDRGRERRQLLLPLLHQRHGLQLTLQPQFCGAVVLMAINRSCIVTCVGQLNATPTLSYTHAPSTTMRPHSSPRMPKIRFLISLCVG